MCIRDSYVVYMKKADYISDMLAIMGASQQMLSLEETRIRKGMVHALSLIHI